MKTDMSGAQNSIADLVRLRNDGEITSDEFAALKQKLIYEASALKIGGDSADTVGADTQRQPGGSFLAVAVIAIVGLIYADYARGGIFPDEIYCVVGAGTSFEQAGRTEATSWSANNGCNASRPECATRWTSTPASSHCSHGTLWEAIRTKFHGILA